MILQTGTAILVRRLYVGSVLRNDRMAVTLIPRHNTTVRLGLGNSIGQDWVASFMTDLIPMWPEGGTNYYSPFSWSGPFKLGMNTGVVPSDTGFRMVLLNQDQIEVSSFSWKQSSDRSFVDPLRGFAKCPLHKREGVSTWARHSSIPNVYWGYRRGYNLQECDWNEEVPLQWLLAQSGMRGHCGVSWGVNAGYYHFSQPIHCHRKGMSCRTQVLRGSGASAGCWWFAEPQSWPQQIQIHRWMSLQWVASENIRRLESGLGSVEYLWPSCREWGHAANWHQRGTIG